MILSKQKYSLLLTGASRESVKHEHQIKRGGGVVLPTRNITRMKCWICAELYETFTLFIGKNIYDHIRIY